MKVILRELLSNVLKNNGVKRIKWNVGSLKNELEVQEYERAMDRRIDEIEENSSLTIVMKIG